MLHRGWPGVGREGGGWGLFLSESDWVSLWDVVAEKDSLQRQLAPDHVRNNVIRGSGRFDRDRGRELPAEDLLCVSGSLISTDCTSSGP